MIAAKDNDGTILWSWHIWVTDKPEEYTYKNSQGTYTLMDRNIGASSASVTLWFPVTPLIHCSGHYEDADGDVIIWSSSTTSDSFSRFHIDIDDESVDYWGGKDNAAMTSPVRCMKE